MSRGFLVVAAASLALVAATSHASSTTISPCRRVSAPVWSPDGKQLAYYGTRWPRRAGHGNPNDILQALCTMNADGTNARPLRYTVCTGACADPPDRLAWLPSNRLLVLRDGAILRFAPGSKPRRIARFEDYSFVTNPAGTRLAGGGWPACLRCSVPVTILDAQSGAVVGHAGGNKLDNIAPSLSPDGSKVAFERDASNGSGKTFGIWTARVDGRGLRQLAKVGQQPLWSPVGGTIAYTASVGSSVALRLVPAGGGKSRVLVPHDVMNVFGWSPDGKSIAVELGTGSVGKLSVVDAATGKVRSLLRLAYAPAAAWSPDSSELVANSVPRSERCWSTWRVPADGSKPALLSSCSA